MIQAWDISLGVLLEVDLAELPRDGGEHGGAGGTQARVGVADNEADLLQAALLEALEELAPMHLSLAQGGADAQDGAFAVQPDAQGDEHGAIEQTPALADFLIAGVHHLVRKGSERAVAPSVEFGV